MNAFRSLPVGAALLALSFASTGLAQTSVSPPPATKDPGASGTMNQPSAKPELRLKSSGSHQAAIIPQQQPLQVLAKDLIGRSVVSSDGQQVGEIKDLILDKEGKVNGLVISVGGVLGFGGKEVGISTDAMTLADRGEKGVLIKVSSNELNSAPEFKTRADFEKEMKSDRIQPSKTPAR